MFDFAPLGLVNLARVLAAGLSGGAQVAAATSALAAASSTFGEGGAVLPRERPEGQRGTWGCMQQPVALAPLCATVG